MVAIYQTGVLNVFYKYYTQAVFHMGPSSAPIRPSWVPVGNAALVAVDSKHAKEVTEVPCSSNRLVT